MNYSDFLNQKTNIDHSFGHECKIDLQKAFEYQRVCIKWATQKGRAALFHDCGLGKTIQQLLWACSVLKETNKPVLILAPLSVSSQTVREGCKFGVEVKRISCQEEIITGINITNYEKLERFDCSVFGGVVLDESSILKSFTSSTRNLIIRKFQYTPYKLACTATPAPNDFMEIGNHAEFLGVMSRTEMLSMFFVHDGGETSKWRLKGHARDDFWKWLSSWAMMVRKPSDIGFDDCGFDLPPLNIKYHVVDHGKPLSGQLFKDVAVSLNDQRKARKESIPERLEELKKIITKDEQWLIWCDLNDESSSVKNVIDGCVEVKGSDSPEYKEDKLNGFADGKILTMVTKTSISGFGMNYQNCNNMIFFGLSHSYESLYQAIRRCWRYGQKKEVNVHIIVSDTELPVVENIDRKHKQAEEMSLKMVSEMSKHSMLEIKKTKRETTTYNPKKQMKLPSFV